MFIPGDAVHRDRTVSEYFAAVHKREEFQEHVSPSSFNMYTHYHKGSHVPGVALREK